MTSQDPWINDPDRTTRRETPQSKDWRGEDVRVPTLAEYRVAYDGAESLAEFGEWVAGRLGLS